MLNHIAAASGTVWLCLKPRSKPTYQLLVKHPVLEKDTYNGLKWKWILRSLPFGEMKQRYNEKISKIVIFAFQVQGELLTGRPSPLPTGGQPYPTINIYNHTVVGQDGKIYKGVHQDKLPDILNLQEPSSLTDPSPSITQVPLLSPAPTAVITKSPSM
mgnify:CR=1 FL=1